MNARPRSQTPRLASYDTRLYKIAHKIATLRASDYGLLVKPWVTEHPHVPMRPASESLHRITGEERANEFNLCRPDVLM